MELPAKWDQEWKHPRGLCNRVRRPIWAGRASAVRQFPASAWWPGNMRHSADQYGRLSITSFTSSEIKTKSSFTSFRSFGRCGLSFQKWPSHVRLNVLRCEGGRRRLTATLASAAQIQVLRWRTHRRDCCLPDPTSEICKLKFDALQSLRPGLH